MLQKQLRKPSQEKIDQFLEENPELDDKAAEALRQAPGFVQKRVIQKGKLSDCQNPSSRRLLFDAGLILRSVVFIICVFVGGCF